MRDRWGHPPLELFRIDSPVEWRVDSLIPPRPTRRLAEVVVGWGLSSRSRCLPRG